MKRHVECTDDDGLPKPSEPLPLKEDQKMQETEAGRERAGLIRCSDSDLIEHAALDNELEYEQRADSRRSQSTLPANGR